jgi:hypothetical protein
VENQRPVAFAAFASPVRVVSSVVDALGESSRLTTKRKSRTIRRDVSEDEGILPGASLVITKRKDKNSNKRTKK